jgi:hypothetical protein
MSNFCQKSRCSYAGFRIAVAFLPGQFARLAVGRPARCSTHSRFVRMIACQRYRATRSLIPADRGSKGRREIDKAFAPTTQLWVPSRFATATSLDDYSDPTVPAFPPTFENHAVRVTDRDRNGLQPKCKCFNSCDQSVSVYNFAPSCVTGS